MTTGIHQILLERLHQQGINTEEAHALLRDLFKILESNPVISPAAASSKLQLLGWNGVTLDYQTFQLALAWMELGNKKGDLE